MAGAYQLGTFSNSADWRDTVQLFDEDGPYDLSGLTVTDLKLEVRGRDGCPILLASLEQGTVTEVDASIGLYSFVFPATDTKKLRPAQYPLGAILVTDEGGQTITTQIVLDRVQVLDGVIGQRGR